MFVPISLLIGGPVPHTLSGTVRKSLRLSVTRFGNGHQRTLNGATGTIALGLHRKFSGKSPAPMSMQTIGYLVFLHHVSLAKISTSSMVTKSIQVAAYAHALSGRSSKKRWKK